MKYLLPMCVLFAFFATRADFLRVHRKQVPVEAINALCDDDVPDPECEQDFRQNGRAYRVDVNDDGVDEFLIHLGGGDSGTGGDGYTLMQKQEGRWKQISGAGGWQIYHPLYFQKLIHSRNGYHDLRIGRSLFVKWTGESYAEFSPDDFHELGPKEMSLRDPEDAEGLWLIDYAGRKEFELTPRGFPSGKTEVYRRAAFAEVNSVVSCFSEYKGGLWCGNGKERYLVLPRATYLGATDIEVQGDWLVAYGDPWCNVPCDCGKSHLEIARYQWRTHQIKISPCARIPFTE